MPTYISAVSLASGDLPRLVSPNPALHRQGTPNVLADLILNKVLFDVKYSNSVCGDFVETLNLASVVVQFDLPLLTGLDTARRKKTSKQHDAIIKRTY